MITLPVVLIAAAVLLLLGLLLGLFLQRRRTAGATPPGPRTVADLVQQRAERDPAPTGPVEQAVAAPVPDEAAVASTVDEPGTTADPGPADSGPVDPDPVDSGPVDEPPAAEPAPATAARAIAPLGDDVPWRRAAQMAGTADADAAVEAEPAEVGRVPALALLRRPSRRPLPADTRHPFLSSAPHLAVVPDAPSAGGSEAAVPEAVEAFEAGPVAEEAPAAEAGPAAELEPATDVDPVAGAEPAVGVGAAAAVVESLSDAELERPAEVAPSAALTPSAERADVELRGAELFGTHQFGVEQFGVEPVGAEPTGTGPGEAEPTPVASPADDADEPAGAALPLVVGGTALGAIGALAAGDRTGDDPEPDRPDDEATAAEPAEIDHRREMDVRVVASRSDHSHDDLGPVDGGSPEVDGPDRALASAGGDRASDQDAVPAPTTGTVDPTAAGPADEADEVSGPAETRLAPEPAADPAAAVAAPAALAGVAALALTRDTPPAEPDAFPSTDPDVLFDSPPEPAVADVSMPGPAAAVTPAPETPAPETPAPATPAAVTNALGAPDPEVPVLEVREPEEPAPEMPVLGTPVAGTPVPGTPVPGTPVTGVPGTPVPVPEPAAPGTRVQAAHLSSTPTGSPSAAPPADRADMPAPGEPVTAATVAPGPRPELAPTADVAAPVRSGATESRRSPRDPAHLAAEQAAADLALLRTFGDPSARPERAPIVALEGATRPESPRPVGAAQPVRFRTVRRDGTQVPGAAVALLDDRGCEVGAERSATGELTAPHPGGYVLVATAPDHQPGAVTLTVGDAPVDADVLLVRSAALVGVVTGEDGPLAGARVTLVQDGEVVDVAESDADGAYLVADLAAGEYAVSVAAAGCDADVVLVVVPEETECVHDVELEPAGVPAG